MEFYSLFIKIKQILINPSNFFENVKKETGIKQSFIYLMVLSLFSTVLGLVVGQSLQNYYYNLVARVFGFSFPQPKYTIGILILFAFIGYLVILLSSFIMAGILHVWILIFGGKEEYAKTYQLYVYSKTPRFIVGWIPFVTYLTWIYDLVLLIIGTQKIHNISRTKSILMYVIPIVLIISLLLVLAFFVFYVIKSNPQIFQNLTQQKV